MTDENRFSKYVVVGKETGGANTFEMAQDLAREWGGAVYALIEPTTEARETSAPCKLSDAEFYARGIARSRYHDKLFAEGRERPTNEQFDEGWTAAKAFYSTPQPTLQTFGDGHYCTHHPDDPAHGPNCYDADKYFAQPKINVALQQPTLQLADCKLGEPLMHGDKPYRWCETHEQLMLTCERGQPTLQQAIDCVREMGQWCDGCPHKNAERNEDGSCSAYGYNGVDCQSQPCVCRFHTPKHQHYDHIIERLSSLSAGTQETSNGR